MDKLSKNVKKVKDTPDCVLNITLASPHHCRQLQLILQPLLQDLDPDFQYIRVGNLAAKEDTCDCTEPDHRTDSDKDGSTCQSLDSDKDGSTSQSLDSGVGPSIDAMSVGCFSFRSSSSKGSNKSNQNVLSNEEYTKNSSHKSVNTELSTQNDKSANETKEVFFTTRTPEPRVAAPSLAVVLFLREQSPTGMRDGSDELFPPPWRFHHMVELVNTRGHKCMGRQQFYQPGPDLALWAVCPIHCGPQQLRFTLFTRNFLAMVEFYRLVTGHEGEVTRGSFCLFHISSNSKTVVQLAIKQSQISPIVSHSTRLCLQLRGQIKYLTPLLRHQPVRLTRHQHLVRDPDGNELLVKEPCAVAASPKYRQKTDLAYFKDTKDLNISGHTEKPCVRQSRRKAELSSPRHVKSQAGPWSVCTSSDSGRHSRSSVSVSDCEDRTTISDSLSMDSTFTSDSGRGLKPWECTLLETMSILSLECDSPVISLDQLKTLQLEDKGLKHRFIPITTCEVTMSKEIIKHTKL